MSLSNIGIFFLALNTVLKFKTFFVLLLILDQFLIKYNGYNLLFGTTRPFAHLPKSENFVSSLIKMKKMMMTLVICLKLVTLAIFRNRQPDFHFKNIFFLINAVFDYLLHKNS